MGLVRATMGTPGHVRARATPLQPRMGPIRAIGPVWALAGHTGHARAKPVRAPAGAAIWDRVLVDLLVKGFFRALKHITRFSA